MFKGGILRFFISIFTSLLSYYVLSTYVTESIWAELIAGVVALFIIYQMIFRKVFEKKIFFKKALLSGALVQEKPDESTGWIYGFGFTNHTSQAFAWKSDENGILVHFFCSTRKGSIKLDWKVIPQIIIHTDPPPQVELVIDNLGFRLFLPYDSDEFYVSDSVGLTRK